MNYEEEIERREWLSQVGKLAAAAAVAGAAWEIVPAGAQAATPALGPGNPKRKWGMVIDLQRCVRCEACTAACKAENKTPPGMKYNHVLVEETGKYPAVKMRWFPRPCMHCADPACLKSCPVNAIVKRPDNIVFIDYDQCEGKQKCVTACPYGVPIFDAADNYYPEDNPVSQMPSPELGKKWYRVGDDARAGFSRKCTFCMHRQDANGDYTEPTACAQTCTGKAIHFGDLNDPEGELQTLLRTRKSMRLKEEAGTGPSVYYLL